MSDAKEMVITPDELFSFTDELKEVNFLDKYLMEKANHMKSLPITTDKTCSYAQCDKANANSKGTLSSVLQYVKYTRSTKFSWPCAYIAQSRETLHSEKKFN